MPTEFLSRHIGPRDNQAKEMLTELGFSTIDEMSQSVIPKDILSNSSSNPFPPLSEIDAINKLKEIANENSNVKSFIGMGYYGTFTPAVIQRNIFENPGWYTQ